MDNSQKIEQLKQLVDEGILSQEEFDSRIKQIKPAEDKALMGDIVDDTKESTSVEAMSVCPNCGTKGTVMFCPECGTKMVDEKEYVEIGAKEKVCPKCGYKGDYAFCPECGSEMVAASSIDNSQHFDTAHNTITSEEPVGSSILPSSNTASKKGIDKKVLIGGAVAGIIVIIAIIAGIALSGGTNTVEYEDYSFKIPDYYVCVQDEPTMQIYTADDANAMLILSTYYEPSYTVSSFKENKDVIMESLAAGLVGDDLLAISNDGSFSGVEVGGTAMNGRADGFCDEDSGYIYFVVVLQNDDSNKNYTKKVDNIVKSANRLY